MILAGVPPAVFVGAGLKPAPYMLVKLRGLTDPAIRP